jgi:hypothetical protein
MKRLLTTFLLCVLAAGVAMADPAPAADSGKSLVVRTFQFKYKDADRAAAIIKPLVSTEGSMSIQPSTNALVVTDRAENVKTIAAALSDFDKPPQALKLTVRLIAAARGDSAAAVPADLREIAGKLAVLGYNSIEDLGIANVEGHEGEPASVDLTTGYREDFRFGEIDPGTDSVKLNDFKVSKLQKDQLVQLYKASLNLRIGQTLIFGVTKNQGGRALFLVFSVHR